MFSRNHQSGFLRFFVFCFCFFIYIVALVFQSWNILSVSTLLLVLRSWPSWGSELISLSPLPALMQSKHHLQLCRMKASGLGFRGSENECYPGCLVEKLSVWEEKSARKTVSNLLGRWHFSSLLPPERSPRCTSLVFLKAEFPKRKIIRSCLFAVSSKLFAAIHLDPFSSCFKQSGNTFACSSSALLWDHST